MKIRLFQTYVTTVILCLLSCMVVGFTTTDSAPATAKQPPVKAEKVLITPSPTLTPTPTSTPTPTATPTPSPTPVMDCVFEEIATPEGLYYEALEAGEITGPQSKHLNTYNGVFQGPSGRETFYNLNMSLVIKYMRDLGYSEEEYPYWVREDGCKMLGNYIMVAANFSIRPKGTILETSLGTAIVCDTGSFVSDYPEGIDVAVDWVI
jgi:Predicted solute binding protein